MAKGRDQAETIEAPLYEIRAASTAGGGTALTTTADYISLPPRTEWVSLTPRNFSGATVVQAILNPKLTILRTDDNLATASAITDFTEELQDGDTTTVEFDSWGLNTDGEYLYVGSVIPFGGVHFDVTNVNGTANDLTVEYWSNGSYVDISAVDNTDTGASLAQDGTVTWTVPAITTDWSKEKLLETVSGAVKIPLTNASLYWTRFYWDVVHDPDTTVAQLRALNRSTAYAELLSGQTYEQKIPHGAFSTVEALTDAGTANLIVNVGTSWGTMFE